MESRDVESTADAISVTPQYAATADPGTEPCLIGTPLHGAIRSVQQTGARDRLNPRRRFAPLQLLGRCARMRRGSFRRLAHRAPSRPRRVGRRRSRRNRAPHRQGQQLAELRLAELFAQGRVVLRDHCYDPCGTEAGARRVCLPDQHRRRLERAQSAQRHGRRVEVRATRRDVADLPVHLEPVGTRPEGEAPLPTPRARDGPLGTGRAGDPHRLADPLWRSRSPRPAMSARGRTPRVATRRREIRG